MIDLKSLAVKMTAGRTYSLADQFAAHLVLQAGSGWQWKESILRELKAEGLQKVFEDTYSAAFKERAQRREVQKRRALAAHKPWNEKTPLGIDAGFKQQVLGAVCDEVVLHLPPGAEEEAIFYLVETYPIEATVHAALEAWGWHYREKQGGYGTSRLISARCCTKVDELALLAKVLGVDPVAPYIEEQAKDTKYAPKPKKYEGFRMPGDRR